MLLVFNNQGNIEEGFLRTNNKTALTAYRDSLLEETAYNYNKNVNEVVRRLRNEELYKTRSYVDGEELIQESYLEFLGYIIPFELYSHKFKKTSIKCNNFITIQILTRILKDYYDVIDKKIISKFVEMGLMNLHLEFPQSLYDHHIGIENLMNPTHEQDLRSFRNSFPFLEFVITEKHTFEEISKMNDETIKYHELNTSLNVIASNTQILFGESIKMLKKSKINR